MMKYVASFIKDETGATAIEYALMAAATGLALGATIPTLQANLTSTWSTIGGLMK